MRREDLVVFLVLGTVLASLSIVVYVDWFIFRLLPFPIPPIGTLIAVVILGGLLLIHFRVGTFQGAGALHLLDYLSHRFRLKAYRVVEKPGRLQIRIGSSSALNVHVHAMANEADVWYQVGATRSGWARLAILVLFDWTGLVTIAAGLYLFLRVRRSAARDLLPLFPPGAGVPSGPPEDPARTALLDALAESHRLAVEALETERSTLWNFGLVLLASGFLLWALIMGTLRIDSALPTFGGADVVLAAAMIFAAAAGAGRLLLRRFARPRLQSSRTWADRLLAALVREANRAVPEEAEASSFELLAEASTHVPAWIGARQKAGILNDPGPGTLFAIAVALAIVAVYGAVSIDLIGALTLALLAGLIAIGLFLVAAVGHRAWRRSQQDAFTRTSRDWERRLAAFHDSLERFLRDL